jgi:hypothetical protein
VLMLGRRTPVAPRETDVICHHGMGCHEPPKLTRASLDQQMPLLPHSNENTVKRWVQSIIMSTLSSSVSSSRLIAKIE